jgi:dTMP kinase
MFITLEGIEGSGKTSQIKYIAEFLETKGHNCVVTREPGGTAIGEKIRAILLNPDNSDMAPHTELLLYLADRVQHVHALIKPSLEAGKTVICDRFMDATLVYQGCARGVDVGFILDLQRMVLGSLLPDITLLLDLSPEQGLSRAWRQVREGGRTGSETRFEKETLSFHETIRSGYLDLARMEKDRFRIIDAAPPEKQVRKDIMEVISKEIQARGDA